MRGTVILFFLAEKLVCLPTGKDRTHFSGTSGGIDEYPPQISYKLILPSLFVSWDALTGRSQTPAGVTAVLIPLRG